MLDLWKADVRDAVRGFVRHPGFVAAAVLSLALGIGANTAIFSVASALILRPLPYAGADRLVLLWNRSPGLGIAEDWFSSGQYFDVKTAATGLEQVAIVYGANENLSGDGGEPQRIGTLRVSSNFFPMFGVQAAAGAPRRFPFGRSRCVSFRWSRRSLHREEAARSARCCIPQR